MRLKKKRSGIPGLHPLSNLPTDCLETKAIRNNLDGRNRGRLFCLHIT
jgi:hypothetical protein